LATFADANLTAQEEALMFEFLQTLRRERRGTPR
jgi:hypothetical protein